MVATEKRTSTNVFFELTPANSERTWSCYREERVVSYVDLLNFYPSLNPSSFALLYLSFIVAFAKFTLLIFKHGVFGSD